MRQAGCLRTALWQGARSDPAQRPDQRQRRINEMQIGVVGLGRMGANISRRLMQAGHASVVWDASQAAIDALGKDGATTATSLQDLVGKLTGSPKAVWVMLPHGKITEDTIAALATLLAEDDIIIDGGNTYYKDDIRRGKALAVKGLH